jgi:nucleoside 2-deoxyribosyltransferase
MKPETRALLDRPDTATRGVYLAGPSGFNDAGRLWHNSVLVPKVEAAGLIPLDPWADQSALDEILSTMPWGAKRRKVLATANLVQGRLDLEMVRVCAAVLATLDGPQVDDGTSVEIGYAHHAGKLIVGLRTDIRRTADNEAALVNLMIETCVADSNGIMTDSVDEAVGHIARALLGT